MLVSSKKHLHRVAHCVTLCLRASGPCTGAILQPRLHGAMALIPTPSFGFAQTCTVGPHGCWDCLGGVPAKPNEGFSLCVRQTSEVVFKV